MKPFKFSLITALALGGLIALAPCGQAADAKPDKPKDKKTAPAASQPGAGNRLNALTKQLNLTTEQQAKLRPVFEKEAKELKALRENTALQGPEKRQKTQAIRAELEKKMKEVLTPAQLEKWEQMRAQAREKANPNTAKPKKEKPQK